jgi:50S ribosomal subunit-associated GTPase HflX
MIIGLSGYAQVGKDTVANILVQHHGYKRVAFADKIRECLFALDPIIAVRLSTHFIFRNTLMTLGGKPPRKFPRYADSFKSWVLR